MKKVFDRLRVILSPSPSGMTGEQFEMLEGIGVPSTKGLDDEGLEGNALSPAIVKVLTNLGGLAHGDGGGRGFSGAQQNGFLRARTASRVNRKKNSNSYSLQFSILL